MRKLLLFTVCAVASCDVEPSGPAHQAPPPGPHQETGPELQEKGRVLETAFRMGSSTTTSTAAPGYTKTISKSFIDDPFGLHKRAIDVPSTQSTSTVTVQDQFAVVFECQHGKFIIESLGKESKAHKLWMKLKQGDEVTILYKEVFSISLDRIGERSLVKYEFVDAYPAKAEK